MWRTAVTEDHLMYKQQPQKIIGVYFKICLGAYLEFCASSKGPVNEILGNAVPFDVELHRTRLVIFLIAENLTDLPVLQNSGRLSSGGCDQIRI